MNTHDRLQGGTVARLAAMRRYRDAWNADPQHRSKLPDGLAGALQARSHGVGLWQSCAHGLAGSFAADPARRTVSAPWGLVDGWRDVGDAQDIVRIGHTGWYSDAFQDALYVGHVWQLPARGGSPVYVAGYVEKEGRKDDSRGSGYVVLECAHDRLETYDEKEDAARAGDALAERNAEREREYSERWSEAYRENDKRDDARAELKTAHAHAHDIIRAWRVQQKTGPLTPDVCAILRGDLDDMRDAMRKAIETMAGCNDRIAELNMAGEF